MKFRVLFVLIALFVIALPAQAQADIDDITIARDASLGDVLRVLILWPKLFKITKI